jgi:hypothetical protein
MEKVTDPAELIPEDVHPKDNTGKSVHIISPMYALLSPPTPHPSHVPFRRQFKLCLSRAFKITMRNRVALASRFLKVVFLGVVLGTLFLNIGTDQNSVSYIIILTLTRS